MHYPPVHHQEENYNNIVQLMQMYPLAIINSSMNNEIESTHTPLVYQHNEQLGVLIGHIDKYNPQLEHFKNNTAVQIIFNGPQVYISPSVYSTTQLPTWNYFKAHLKGTLTIENDREKVKQSLINMTVFLEGDQPKYKLDPDNPRMEAALDYIVGFRIEINSWEGKYKISQDKKQEDRVRAKVAMQAARTNTEKEVALLYSMHQTKKKQ
ncbi:MAG: FMN-binding negative transcriptional regulator [Candidatus Arcticimaribacter sp.]